MLSARRSTCSAGKRRFGASPLVASVLGSVLLVLTGGCDAFQGDAGKGGTAEKGGEKILSPVLKRMQETYADLESGRFISLADFESPGQVALFRTAGPEGSEDGRPQPSLSILRSRNETGAGSLKARLEHAADRLLLDGRRSEQLALVHDWRDYALLLMSVYGPPGGAALEFSVQSGAEAPIQWSRTINVAPGWNLFRLDVDTIGDAIDLADVRALAWRARQAATPVEFYLDDLILVDNTRHLVGENGAPQELYVFTRGRRIHVGVRNRFELAFADGLIVAWRGSGGENLADIGGLGPWPVPLSPDWSDGADVAVAYDDPQLFASWGPAVATVQRLNEVSPFRVVIEGRWRFADPATAPPTDQPASAALPGHTWQYVVYASGRLHVRVTSSPGEVGWSAPRVGYAVGLDGRRDFCHIQPPSAAPGVEPVQFVLLARLGRAQADLLWTWPRAKGFERQRALVSVDERRLAALVGDVAATPVVETVHLLRLWPSDIDAAPEAESLAGDAQNPATLTPTAGRLLTDVPGDLDHDGYNESEGCYELASLDGRLRFDFDPGGHVRFDPVFRLHETAQRRCWVYARGRAVKNLGRDADRNLLFRLGRVSGRPLGVEVHSVPWAAKP